MAGELTLLRLDPIGVPPYSARGITEDFSLDGDAQLAPAPAASEQKATPL